MFPQLKKINNESGIVLFITLMTAIIIIIFALGVLTQSMNEINYAQQQIDQIESDELNKGALWSSFATGNMSSALVTANLNGRIYITNTSSVLNGGDVLNTWTVTTNYDSF